MGLYPNGYQSTLDGAILSHASNERAEYIQPSSPTVSLSYDAWSDSSVDNTTGRLKKIDWVVAEKNGNLAAFSAEITSRLEPLYSRVYDDTESISGEIEGVASILKETADRLLPCIEPITKKRRDGILSYLCAKS